MKTSFFSVVSAGHTEKAWFLFDSNFNFDLKLPIPDPENEEKLLEFVCKSHPDKLCENWITLEEIREQAESLPGAFTWDQDRRV